MNDMEDGGGNMKWIFTVFLMLLLFLPSVGLGQDYVIGEGDVLKITVYDNNDLTTQARVSGEGSILVPLIGAVKVGGMTIAQATRKIADLFADGYLVDPQVQIYIEQFQSKKVTVLGQVNKPGLVELDKRTSLLELISKAGGLTKEAGKELIIKHRSTGKASEEKSIDDVVRVDMEGLVEKGDATQNIDIQDGDTVYVSKEELQYVYVTGEVKKPDAYKYDEKQPLTVIQAITLAGGLSAKAAPGRVKVIRKKEDGQNDIFSKADMDMPVLPGDIVVVPESFF
jgi:polysaccharide biosynthesis/export protein